MVGIQESIETMDSHGNRRIFPDLEERTPYFIVEVDHRGGSQG
jgi:hypothetical protein